MFSVKAVTINHFVSNRCTELLKEIEARAPEPCTAITFKIFCCVMTNSVSAIRLQF